jgi:alanine racemase
LQEIEVGDEVVLIGRQGNETVTIEEIAAKIPSITPTIPTALTSRIPRVYV